MSDEDFVPCEQAGLEPIGSFLGQALIAAMGAAFPAGKVTVEPQFVWRKYRIDWAILDGGAPILFIECDGRDYHSSEDARRRDAARDDECWAAGIRVVRFTGSQIHHAARPCAEHIVGLIVAIRGTDG